MERKTLKEVLSHIKGIGFKPKTIIDVGVAYGTPGLYDVFDDVQYLLVDPLREYEHVMKDICSKHPGEYIVAAAGEAPGSMTLNVHPDLSGSSFYKESEGSHVDGEPREVPVITLDDLIEEKKTEGPYILKVDTQGADLNVLAGASEVLKQTEVVLLEVFLFQFYKDIPLFHDIVNFMKKRGFVAYEIFGGHCRPYDKALAQLDMAFVKEKGIFRKTNDFATKAQRKEFTKKRIQLLNPKLR